MPNPPNAPPTLAFAVALRRSGRNVTFDVLRALGASLGPPEIADIASGDLHEDLSLPDELMTRLRQSPEAYPSSDVPEETLRIGRTLLSRVAASGDVVACSDPRLPLIWPVWRTLLEELTDVRVVLLYLVRSPHAGAMGVNLRSGGDYPYEAALDAYEAELGQLKKIREGWKGEWTLIRYGGHEFLDDLRHAATLSGLRWSEAVARQVIDARKRPPRHARVNHPAQALFDELAGETARLDPEDNERVLQEDARLREAVLRQKLGEWRSVHAALSRELKQRTGGEAPSIASQIDELRKEIRELRDDL